MNIPKKLYEDYFKKSRLEDYEYILSYAKNNGYKMVGIYDFYNIVTRGMSNGVNGKIKMYI